MGYGKLSLFLCFLLLPPWSGYLILVPIYIFLPLSVWVLRLSLPSPCFILPLLPPDWKLLPQTCLWLISPSPLSLQKGWHQKRKNLNIHCLKLSKQCGHTLLAQSGPCKLATDLMNQPGALCHGHPLIVKRENSPRVRGENVEVTLSHLSYHFTYGVFFSSRQDYWKDHNCYITKMEEY